MKRPRGIGFHAGREPWLRRSPGIVRRAALLVLAMGLPGGAPPALAEASPGCPPSGAVLTVRGAASIDEAPDAAALTVSVVTRAPNLDLAVRNHKERVGRARAVLDRLAAAGVAIAAGAFSLGEEIPPAEPGSRSGPPAPVARAETRFDLTLRDLSGIDARVGEIAAAGLFEVESARFVVTDVGAAKDRARRAAMADARHQAEVYADAGGLRLDAIERITDAEAAGSEAAFALPRAKALSASVGIAPPKTLAFEGGVTVTWRLLPR